MSAALVVLAWVCALAVPFVAWLEHRATLRAAEVEACKRRHPAGGVGRS